MKRVGSKQCLSFGHLFLSGSTFRKQIFIAQKSDRCILLVLVLAEPQWHVFRDELVYLKLTYFLSCSTWSGPALQGGTRNNHSGWSGSISVTKSHSTSPGWVSIQKCWSLPQSSVFCVSVTDSYRWTRRTTYQGGRNEVWSIYYPSMK